MKAVTYLSSICLSIILQNAHRIPFRFIENNIIYFILKTSTKRKGNYEEFSELFYFKITAEKNNLFKEDLYPTANRKYY